METLIESIRLALVSDATDEAKATGANACRTILAALDGKVGEPIAPAVPSMAQLAHVITALRGMPAENLLDMAIARLRTALPAGTEPPAVKSINFRLAPPPRGIGS